MKLCRTCGGENTSGSECKICYLLDATEDLRSSKSFFQLVARRIDEAEIPEGHWTMVWLKGYARNKFNLSDFDINLIISNIQREINRHILGVKLESYLMSIAWPDSLPSGTGIFPGSARFAAINDVTNGDVLSMRRSEHYNFSKEQLGNFVSQMLDEKQLDKLLFDHNIKVIAEESGNYLIKCFKKKQAAYWSDHDDSQRRVLSKVQHLCELTANELLDIIDVKKYS